MQKYFIGSYVEFHLLWNNTSLAIKTFKDVRSTLEWWKCFEIEKILQLIQYKNKKPLTLTEPKNC